MPNRLSVAKREKRAEEKVHQAEEKFKASAAAKQRKVEKKAQRLAERKSAAASELINVQEGVEFATPKVQMLVRQEADHAEELHANADIAGEPIEVLAQCMTGEEFWLTPLPQASVFDLKCMLSEVWGIPPVCQRLLVDCTMLCDSELLSQYVQDEDNGLICTAVVVVGEVRDPAVLAKLAVRGTEGVRNAVLHVLASEDDGIRYQLFTELQKMAEQGDAQVTAVLIQIMKSASGPCIKTEILETLARVGTNCEQVKVEVVAQLQDSDASVRIAALQALSHFARNHSVETIRTVSECLNDEQEDVRFQAVQVLTDISKDHADAVVAEVKMHLKHAIGGVRRAAVQALSQIVAQGDDDALDIFIMLSADRDADVRAAAVQAIDCVALPNDEHAFNALVAVLFDPDWIVRQLTLRALKRFADKNDGLLVRAAKPFLRHTDPIMRHTAVEALGTVMHSIKAEAEDVISDLQQLCSDSDLLVKSSVAHILRDFPKRQKLA